MTASRPKPRPRGRPVRQMPLEPEFVRRSARARPPADPPKRAPAKPAPRRRTAWSSALIVLLLLLIGVILFWVVAEVFGAMLKLETVAVEWAQGETPIVSDASVTAAAGLLPGDRLYTIDTAAVEAAVLRSNPYLASVKVERRLPDTIALICTPREAAYYIEVDDEWFAISTELVVLEQSRNEATFVERGLVRVILPEVQTALVGQALAFSGDFSTDYLHTLLDTHRASTLWGETDLLRINSRFDVRLIVRGSYALTLGSSEDAALKLELAEKILSDALLADNSGAFLDLSNPEESSAILDKQTDYSLLWRD